MPFVAPNVLRGLNGHNQQALTQALSEFESEVGAPVRVIDAGGESRTVTRMASWTGDSAHMTHYTGYTEEDRDERGLTVITNTWNGEAHEDARPGWRYIYLDASLYEDWTRERQSAEIEVRAPEIQPQQIIDAEGIPLVSDTSRPNGNEVSNVYGEIFDRMAFLYLSFGAYSNWGSADYKALVFNALLENSSEEAKEAARLRRAEIERETFTRMMEDQGNLAIVELRKKSDDLSQRRGQLEEELTNAKFDQEQVGTQLVYLIDSQDEVTPEEIAAEWEAIERNVKVKSFTCGQSALPEQQQPGRIRRAQRRNEVAPNSTNLTSGYVKLRTELLFLIHPETKRKVPLGEYEITMNFGANSLRIKNITNAMDGSYIDHPHVAGGLLCAADYGTTITELLRKRKLAGMTGMVFNILSTLTMSDGTAVARFRYFEEADDRKRREEGWPAWEEGEEEHPMYSVSDDDESEQDSTEPSTESETDSTNTSSDDDTENGDEDNG